MFWLGLFVVAFGPAIIAQLHGHPRAGTIIALDPRDRNIDRR
jgi:hypothetical protein